MLTKTLVTTILALLPFTAFSADLDAPVTQKPTIRTEIERGQSMAVSCQSRNTDAYTVYTTCIDGIITRANAAGNASDPFKLGVYSSAWEMTSIQLEVYEANSYNPQKVASMKQLGWFYYVWSNDILKKLQMTSAQLCAAKSVRDCAMYDRMNKYWAAVPTPTP